MLDTGPDPWRPSRRQKLAAIAAVLVAALAAGVVLQVRHERHERDLDAASVRDVLVVAEAQPDPALDSVDFVLTNLTPTLLRVERATLEPGGARLVGDAPLVPGLPVRWGYDDARPCTLDLLRQPSDRVVLDLVTPRGVRVSRTVQLTGMAEGFQAHERTRCGYATSEEAFTAGVHVTRVRRGVAVELTLTNRSVLPLTLTSITTPPGMTMSGLTLPLRLPADHLRLARYSLSHPAAGPPVRRRLVLRITDCATFLRDGSLMGRAALDGVVQGPTGSAPLVIPLDGTALNPTPRDDLFGAFYELAHDCGRRGG